MTTFGWFSFLRILISLIKLTEIPYYLLFLFYTLFIATYYFVYLCWARYTWPKFPCPCRFSFVYMRMFWDEVVLRIRFFLLRLIFCFFCIIKYDRAGNLGNLSDKIQNFMEIWLVSIYKFFNF